MMGLRVTDLSVSYRDANGKLFEAVTVEHHEFLPGTFTAITGPSGSGKTSFLHALSGIINPEKGSVEWQGRNVTSLSTGQRDGWRRQTVGYVFQDFQLVPELSPFANVSLPGTFSNRRAPSGSVRKLLTEFGLPIDRARTSQLSRGEQQRVAFARALYFDPPIILADEPTASLDADNSALVIGRLQALAKVGKVVIAVSHDADLIKACDFNLRFSRGKLIPEPVK
jgi:putative ABC transport system ATP-binding protein